MTISAIGAYWLGLPIYDYQREAVAKRRLAELGWRIGAEEIPTSLTKTFWARFHDEATLLRVRNLRVWKGQLAPETFDRILKFKHLRELNLNDTSLTDKQCMRLASLQRLRVLDCRNTPVRYETLLELRSKRPTMCDLAHRRALAQLRHLGAYFSSNADGSSRLVMFADYRQLQGRESDFLQAIAYFGRPLGVVSISDLGIDDSFLEALLQVRSDFKLGLSYDPRLAQRRDTVSRSEFPRIANRVEYLSLANLEFAEVFPLEAGSSVTELELRDVDQTCSRPLPPHRFARSDSATWTQLPTIRQCCQTLWNTSL